MKTEQQNLFGQALAQETPGKVLGLAIASLASLLFLFVVSSTDASFEGTSAYFPDPFSTQSLSVALDYSAWGMNQFVEYGLFEPTVNQIAMVQDNFAWVIDQADLDILKAVGLEQMAYMDVTPKESLRQPQVAGAFVRSAASGRETTGLLNSLYSVITQ